MYLNPRNPSFFEISLKQIQKVKNSVFGQNFLEVVISVGKCKVQMYQNSIEIYSTLSGQSVQNSDLTSESFNVDRGGAKTIPGIPYNNILLPPNYFKKNPPYLKGILFSRINPDCTISLADPVRKKYGLPWCVARHMGDVEAAKVSANPSKCVTYTR